MTRIVCAKAVDALSLYVELSRAGLGALVLMTTAVGFVMGSGHPLNWEKLTWTLFGTAVTVVGANALNQCMERQRDGLMMRTCNRPLPSLRVTLPRVTVVAILLAITGPVVLALRTNMLTVALGLTALLVYLLAYTPLKTRNSLCTMVGAVAGAIPPVMGWTAASGGIGPGAWVLGAILFVWQIPHFLSLGWLFRRDYARAGFRVLPVIDNSGTATCGFIIVFSTALLPVGAAGTLVGLVSWRYLIGSLLFAMLLTALGVELYYRRNDACARRVFVGSVAYLPLLLIVMVTDRGPIEADFWVFAQKRTAGSGDRPRQGLRLGSRSTVARPVRAKRVGDGRPGDG